MTKRTEGEDTNWWSELKVTFDNEVGYVCFKLGKMEYCMTYESFLFMVKGMKEAHKQWKEKQRMERKERKKAD